MSEAISDSPVQERVEERVLLVGLNNPPVNGLSFAVRSTLCNLLQRANSDSRIEAVVLYGIGRCFCAGADIRELGTPAALALPGLSSHVHPAIEACRKPVIAAIHGIAMGGGIETALACHYRIACPDTRIATPEVKLGLIPLSGTQRLPRLLGLDAALKLIVEAREYSPGELDQPGFIHRQASNLADLLPTAVEFAREVVLRGAAHPLVRERAIEDRQPEAIISTWHEKLLSCGGSEAQLGALEAVAAAFREANFDAGLDRARQIYQRLYDSPTAIDARKAFLARRKAPA